MKLMTHLIAVTVGSLAFLSDVYANYSLTINNNYTQTIVASATGSSGTNSIAINGSYTYNFGMGTVMIAIPGYGSIYIEDIGSNHIDGDTTETWGALVSYQDSDTVGRYEGDGNLVINVGTYGVMALSGMHFSDVLISRNLHS